jgi:Uma2 family endonuclease
MLQLPWRERPLTEEEARDLFMIMLEDDTEDAPWMVMGDLQFWSASSFAHSLRNYARERGLAWYVASMLPILYRWRSSRHQLAPDVFVAFVPDHPRQSYDFAAEGTFPHFVLEVVSPSSSVRDENDKRDAYDFLGAREYALFTPREGRPTTLDGYRRAQDGRFEAWQPDEHGRLWSEVLGLFLMVRGRLLYAQTPDGQILRLPEQSEAELAREAQARQQAEANLTREAEARRQAEAEVARLRGELERLRRENPPGDR